MLAAVADQNCISRIDRQRNFGTRLLVLAVLLQTINGYGCEFLLPVSSETLGTLPETSLLMAHCVKSIPGQFLSWSSSAHFYLCSLLFNDSF